MRLKRIHEDREAFYQAIAKIYAQLTQLQYTEKQATNGRRADVGLNQIFGLGLVLLIESLGVEQQIVSVILHFGGIELKFRIFLNLKMKKEKTSSVKLHYLQGSV
ncbi:hypothetical protein ACJX0J_035740 [Zea mays]